MNQALHLTALSTLFLSGGVVHSAVTKSYRLGFQGRYELDAEAVKDETLELLPSLFSRQLTDVEWAIEREGRDFVVVRLTGTSKRRLEGWLHAVQTQTRDAIADIRALR